MYQIAKLCSLRPTLARLGTIIDRSTLQPLLQCHRVNTKIFRDLLDRHTRFTTTRNSDNIFTNSLG